MNILFICSRNRWRSRTAETFFKGNQDHVVRSAGTENDARIKVSEKYSNLFWVTAPEMSKEIPSDVPILLTPDNGYHPDLANAMKPSDTDSFRQLADVIAAGDKSLYHATEPGNTHWKN